jgi:hypothetical protein
MAYIQRANVVLKVKDSEVEYYLNLGYNQIDENGKVTRKTVPNDLHELQKAYKDKDAEIAKLKEEIDFLRNELAKTQGVNQTDETKAKTTRKRTEK